MIVPYKKAALCSTCATDWYVHFSYLNPATGKYQRFKERFDMNRIHNLRERRAYAMEAIAFVNEQLANGFNPFTDRKASGHEAIMPALQRLVQALQLRASATTTRTYQLVLNRFNRFVSDRDLHRMTMPQLNAATAEAFQAWLRADGLSPKTINDQISHMGLFWEHSPHCEANPWRNLKPIRRTQRPAEDKFEPLTGPEMQQIFTYLNAHHRPFARLALMIYYSWARTAELCRLRVADVDLQANLLYFGGSRTKNGRSARVQIVPPLQSILAEMQLQQYPPNYYLFSTGWLPGTAHKHTNQVSERWRELVKEKLEIPKAMYALKHTGNIDYLLQNSGRVDLKWQQMQNRHASAAMTERYCRQLGAYFVDTDELIFTGF